MSGVFAGGIWSSDEPPPSNTASGPSPCSRCNIRPGVIPWSESAIAVHSGLRSKRCEVCVLETQVEHARERAAALPELERRLAEARKQAGLE